MKLQPSGVQGVICRLLAIALAVCSLSDGRTSRVAYAQGATDPTVVKARAAINRGQYADAEAMLKPVAAKAATGEAALELGLLYQMLGREKEARALLDPLSDMPVGPRTSASEYARLGRAARAVGEFQLANDAYRIGSERDPRDPSIHTGWGELFLERHENGEAMKSFQDALEADKNWIPAMLGVAQVLMNENPPQATKAVQAALALDPESVNAYVLMAQLDLDRSDREAAKAQLAKARAINPNSLDAIALAGAIAYVEDRQNDFKSEAAAALKINPRYAGAYRTPADLAASNYRFEEAVALSRQALTVDPNDVQTLAALGVQLLRTGDEAEARKVLEKAWSVDRSNVTTKNLLDMLDKLEKFDVINSEGGQPAITVKLDSKESPVMREFVGLLATRAIAALSKKYDFTPTGPILIEMFPRHDDFAVRTVGLPGMIGALGACFGRVVTIDSPKARPPGDFNWEPTLWHELAHVFTLQLSKQRVPRWLTEGISVYEEKVALQGWGREGELTFAAAYGRGEHMSLKELNAAFQDPEKISLAYYEASLLAEHIVNTYGMGALRKLLQAYGQGLEGESALRTGLGIDLDRLQKEFDGLLSKRYDPIVKAMTPPKDLVAGGKGGDPEATAKAFPDSFQAQIAYGEFLWKSGRTTEAYQVLERAAQMVPMATGPKSPHAMMAQIAIAQKDRARTIKELEALLEYAHTDLDSARLLTKELEQARGDQKALMVAYERVSALDPFDAANHSALGRVKLQSGDAAGAARAFRAALAAGALDAASANADLADAYLALGDKVRAKRAALAAMEVAPGYQRAQDLLLKLVGP